MRRLYLLLPDEPSLRALVEELEASGVPEHALHVLDNLSHDLSGLPQASLWQKTELAHGLEWGLLLGAFAGLVGGWLVVAFPPGELLLDPQWLLGITTGGGALVGAMVSALLGAQEHNHLLDHFKRQIKQGQILLMVDLPRARVEETRELMRRYHPEVEVGELQARKSG